MADSKTDVKKDTKKEDKPVEKLGDQRSLKKGDFHQDLEIPKKQLLVKPTGSLMGPDHFIFDHMQVPKKGAKPRFDPFVGDPDNDYEPPNPFSPTKK